MKKQQASHPQKSAAHRPEVIAWLFLAVVILQVVGQAVSSRLTWGFGFWNIVPAAWAYGLLAAALILLVPAVSGQVSEWLARLVRPVALALARVPVVISGAVSSAALLGLFYFFRAHALVYGDGYLVLREYTSPILHSNFELMKPLSAPFHQLLYTVLSSIATLPPADAVAFVNAVGGLVAFWALYYIAKLLTDSRTGKWFLLTAALTSGAVMLFFGYIENYTWPTAVGLWSLSFSIGYVKERNRLWPALLFGMLATLFHATAVIYLAVAALAWTYSSEKVNRIGARRAFRWTIALAVSGSVAAAILVQLFLPHKYLVPLWPIPGNHYWVLSPAHILDTVNIAVLVAPIGVVAILSFRWTLNLTPACPTTEEYVLASAAVLSFLVAFWIDPVLGAPRDWDLLSLFGFPLSIWAARSLLIRYPRLSSAPGTLFGAVVVCAICILPNIAEKTHLNAAVKRLDNLLWVDPHYQTDYNLAERCGPWALTLHNDARQGPRPTLRYYRRTAVAPPRPCMAWYNLGNMSMEAGDQETAYRCLTTSIQINPDYSRALAKLSEVEVAHKQIDDALRHATRAVELEPDNASIQSKLGIALAMSGRQAEALVSFRRAHELEPASAERMQNLGLAYANVGQSDSAVVYLRAGLFAPTAHKPPPSLYAALVNLAIDQGELDIAAEALQCYRKLPHDTNEEKQLVDRLRQTRAARR